MIIQLEQLPRYWSSLGQWENQILRAFLVSCPLESSIPATPYEKTGFFTLLLFYHLKKKKSSFTLGGITCVCKTEHRSPTLECELRIDVASLPPGPPLMPPTQQETSGNVLSVNHLWMDG